MIVCQPHRAAPAGRPGRGARGRHLLIEKPVSHSLDGVDELAREPWRARRSACLVGFQFRFHPGLRQVRAWLAEGAIGPVVSAHLEWGEYLPDWHPGEDYRRGYSARRDLGGGVILTLCHPFDTLRWLLGEVRHGERRDRRRLSGLGAGRGGRGPGDAALRERAPSAASRSTTCSARRRHALRIVGRYGQIRWDAARRSGAPGAARPRRRGLRAAVRASSATRCSSTRCATSSTAWSGRAAPGCTLDDGTRALRIALAALESARTGRRIDV